MNAYGRLKVISLSVVAVAIFALSCTKSKGPAGPGNLVASSQCPVSSASPMCPPPANLCSSCPNNSWGVCYQGGIWTFETVSEAVDYPCDAFGPAVGDFNGPTLGSSCPVNAYYFDTYYNVLGQPECWGSAVNWNSQYSYGSCTAPDNTFSCISSTTPYALTTPCSLTTSNTCTCPTAGQTYCAVTATNSTGCVDTTSDNNNCGSCGSVCSSGQFCTAGVCAAPTPLCSGKPVWFQADNNGEHYKFGAAPFSANTTSPFTQSYAALDAECVKQAGVLDNQAGKNNHLTRYQWKAVVIMPENGLTFNQTAVERDFYQHVIDYNTDYNCQSGTCTKPGNVQNPKLDPINCVDQKLYLSSSFQEVTPYSGGNTPPHPVLFYSPSAPGSSLVTAGESSGLACNNLSAANSTSPSSVASLVAAANLGTGWFGPPAATPACNYTFDLICVAQMPALPAQ